MIKFIVLIGFIFAGAYAQHKASSEVEEFNHNQRSLAFMKVKVNEQDEKFMHRAIELSHYALKGNQGLPFGSVVVKEGRIIGEGWNRTISLNDPTAHAEMEAIRKAFKAAPSQNLKDCVLYTSAQPCSMCLSLVQLAGIRKVFYCIPARDMAGYSEFDMQVKPASNEMNKNSPLEIPLLQDQVENVIKSYREKKTHSAILH